MWLSVLARAPILLPTILSIDLNRSINIHAIHKLGPPADAAGLIYYVTFKKTSRFVCLTKLVCARRILGIVRPIQPILIKI